MEMFEISLVIDIHLQHDINPIQMKWMCSNVMSTKQVIYSEIMYYTITLIMPYKLLFALFEKLCNSSAYPKV